MFHFHADDGRILTPPKELKPLLKDSYYAFHKLLGHIRFFYVADEIWDGKAALVFRANDEQLATITLDEGKFYVGIADDNFDICDVLALDIIFKALNKTATAGIRRPTEQLTANLEETPSGIRCDMCLLYSSHNKDDFEGCRKFPILDRNCYYGVNEGWGQTVFSPTICDGTQCFIKTYNCLEKKDLIIA